ncbi:MAG: AMP-binding protein [Anaerolineaceae bacterium]|nr:AMP-binding protein [Anaerolineaceae bacterium]
MQNFSSILLDHFHKHPQKTIITLLSGTDPDDPITYQQLLQRSSAYTKQLMDQGVKSGDVVIIILQHGDDLIYAYWGAILLGAIPSIMPFLTEKLLSDRYRSDLSALIDHTKPVGIITYSDFEDEVRTAIPADQQIKMVLSEMVDLSQTLDLQTLSGLSCSADEVVLLQHSSGTTGLQKGVALSHHAVQRQLDVYGDSLHLTEDDVIISWLPLYHDMGLIACFIMPILKGVHTVLMSPFEWVRAPYRLMQAISNFKGTLVWLPNFAYAFCSQKIRDRQLEGCRLDSLRAVINCSEPTRLQSHQKFAARFEPYGLNPAALLTCYAMAENVFAVTQATLGEDVPLDIIDKFIFTEQHQAAPPTTQENAMTFLSAGPLLPNVQVKILSPENQELPDRQVGEIALKSDCMLSGYYHRPDITQKAFHKGFFLTGDYGYMVEGNLYVSGRKKDLIIVGGKNIYPQDIETLVMEIDGVHPGRVCAFGIFNENAGTEDVVVVAEVDTKDPDEQIAISDTVRKHVTKESAVALRHVHVVKGPWLAKTSSGKISRSANREKYVKEVLGE